ncbi:NFACT family protein, partial [Staphylococcus aureus]|uniref:NFACT family protein n=1 Tax=Staphylococcus aureus TaxID=1280 RepID=UPI0016429D45
LQLTTKKYHNPFNPPIFPPLFTKHLQPAIIQSIKQIPNHPPIQIHINTKHEIPHTIYPTVILHIIPKHTNLILLHQNPKIIEPFKHLTPNTNHY